jgi:hypothetical protein
MNFKLCAVLRSWMKYWAVSVVPFGKYVIIWSNETMMYPYYLPVSSHLSHHVDCHDHCVQLSLLSLNIGPKDKGNNAKLKVNMSSGIMWQCCKVYRKKQHVESSRVFVVSDTH